MIFMHTECVVVILKEVYTIYHRINTLGMEADNVFLGLSDFSVIHSINSQSTLAFMF